MLGHNQEDYNMTVQVGASLLQLVNEMQDRKKFQELNWTGTFGEYLDFVTQNSSMPRSA
jgi:serine protein kinase